MMRCPQCLQLIGVSTATGVCAACAPRQAPPAPTSRMLDTAPEEDI